MLMKKDNNSKKKKENNHIRLLIAIDLCKVNYQTLLITCPKF